MNRIIWAAPTSNHEVFRRAGGRRKYNAKRKRQAEARKNIVWKMINQGDYTRAEIARTLGVHRSTITRDIQSFSPFHQFMAKYNLSWSKMARTLENAMARESP